MRFLLCFAFCFATLVSSALGQFAQLTGYLSGQGSQFTITFDTLPKTFVGENGRPFFQPSFKVEVTATLGVSVEALDGDGSFYMASNVAPGMSLMAIFQGGVEALDVLIPNSVAAQFTTGSGQFVESTQSSALVLRWSYPRSFLDIAD
ncbi:hypothetical protein DM01DRAFT_312495 [Hesseltinella vesiculosa]|uniref:Concanavalin A-like lectin/glucanase n=1 Tax=Hesseltinella vesiculosa TaxID=101127 RepID=A0A1X2GEB7_9FUNG|nr:hypothetical protein DM01DRAFT_312495 [Hesseltinella vesiculosa]